MSIFDETRQQDPLTEGWRALDLFTDRHEAIRLFSSLLNDDPPRKRILFFYGDGGNGKSLLLRFLREHYFKRLSAENWEYIRNKTNEELAWHLKNAADVKPVLFALLDFGMKPVGEDRPQETFSALLMLRRALAHSAREANCRLRFPLYDFACIWYLYKTHTLTEDRLQSLFPAEEMEFVSEVVNAISETSAGTFGKTVLSIFSKHSRAWFTLYKQRRHLDEGQVQRIRRMDPESELVPQLSRLFAEDLNVAMSLSGAPERVLLIFDTHEAFWGNQRNLAPELFFQRDEWLRCLLASIEFSAGIVAVVAGRDRPRWAEASKCRIPEEFIEPFLVGHLSEADAMSYLECAGITDATLRQSLVAYARVEPDQVHPLYLGLCADVVLAASGKDLTLTPADFRVTVQTADKGDELIHRLLRYVDVEVEYAVRALCACRAFDAEIYRKLGQALNFQVTEPTFRSVLTQFSFVWQAQQRGQGWYRIHDLMRRLLQERGDEVTRRAHQALEEHYRACVEAGEPSAIAEAIYHANRLDWERGVNQWVEAFDAALQSGRYGICRALLDIRPELLVATYFDLGRILQSEGDYFGNLALYDEATQKYLEAINAWDEELRHYPEDADLHNNKGNALSSLGGLQATLSQHQAAAENYTTALAIYDEALRLAPDLVYAHNSKGAVLSRLGQLQATLSKYEAATENYTAGIAAYDEALRLVPDYVLAHHNKGDTLSILSDLQVMLSQHEAAAESYTKALAAYDEALQLAPDLITTYNSKGNAFLKLGELQAMLSKYEAAAESYTAAIAAYDEALRLAPDYISARFSKGNALQSLGRLQATLAQHEAAVVSYTTAVAACDELLRLAPDDLPVHNSKGNALSSLGALQTELSLHETAVASYTAAIAAYDVSLRLATDDIWVYHNKGFALTNLGILQARLSQYEAAAKSYTAAVAACNEALRLAPDFVSAHNNKGLAFANFGELQATLTQHDAAIAKYTTAIAAYDEALRLAPDYVFVYSNKSSALTNLGYLQATLSQHEAAAENYRAAVAACDKALWHAPDLVLAHNNKGGALQRLGELQAELSQHEAAVENFMAAVAAYDEALRLAPNYILAYNNRGAALLGLGVSQAALSQHEAAAESYTAAIAVCNEALRLAPDSVLTHNNKGAALQKLGELQSALAQHSYKAAIASYDEVLRLAPGSVMAHNNKGQALTMLGKLQSALSQLGDALESFRAALSEFNQSLEISPIDDVIRKLRDELQKFIDEQQ